MIIEVLKGNGMQGIRVELSIFQMQELQEKMHQLMTLMVPTKLKDKKATSRSLLIDELRKSSKYYDDIYEHLEDMATFIDKIAPVPCKTEVKDSLFNEVIGVQLKESKESISDQEVLDELKKNK